MSEQTAGTSGAAPSQAMPPFYKKPALLDSNRHSHLSLKESSGYAFAQESMSIFVNVTEFAVAARHYPIVFTTGDVVAPVAIVGVRQGQNLYVNEAGEWQRDTYVPAYVRRYPFILVANEDKSKLGLCVDEESAALTESDVRPLFRNGQRTDLVEQALNFCTAFHREAQTTDAFCRAVKEQDLLIPNRADVRLKSGERLAVGGFQVVDEGKLNALSDEVFLDWRRRGWIAPLYFHLMSVSNWASLVNRVAEGTKQ